MTGTQAALTTQYKALDEQLSPRDVPDFKTECTTERGHVDAEACVSAMSDWLNEHINNGNSNASYDEHTQNIGYRANIQHWDYRDSPTLPRPQNMDGTGASCVRISLKGTVDPETRYDDPEPKNDTYQHLWNVVLLFAHATGAEVRLNYSQVPRDDLQAYLFYRF